MFFELLFSCFNITASFEQLESMVKKGYSVPLEINSDYERKNQSSYEGCYFSAEIKGSRVIYKSSER